MPFIKDTDTEPEIPQKSRIIFRLRDSISCDDDIHVFNIVFNSETYFSTLLLFGVVRHNIQRRTEFVEFSKPILNCRRRHDDKMRAGDTLLEQMRKKRNDLKRLPQTHVVGENTT